MEGLVVPAVALGIAYAATPGVVNAECVRRGLAGGFRPAFMIQTGALIGDGAWALLGLVGVAALARNRSLGVALGRLGGLYLCRLAFKALREAWRGPHWSSGRAGGNALTTGAIFGLANPAGLAFWAGVGGGMVATAGMGAGGYIAFLVAFMSGALCWSLGLSALVGWARRYVRPSLFRAVGTLCGAALGFFGVRLLWTALRRALAGGH